jgi:hypothetical protein
MSALRFMALPTADARAYQRGEIDANGKCANGRCPIATVSQAVIASPRLLPANRGRGTSTASRCMNSSQGRRLVNPYLPQIFK